MLLPTGTVQVLSLSCRGVWCSAALIPNFISLFLSSHANLVKEVFFFFFHFFLIHTHTHKYTHTGHILKHMHIHTTCIKWRRLEALAALYKRARSICMQGCTRHQRLFRNKPKQRSRQSCLCTYTHV